MRDYSGGLFGWEEFSYIRERASGIEKHHAVDECHLFEIGVSDFVD